MPTCRWPSSKRTLYSCRMPNSLGSMTVCLAQDPTADELLARDPFALLTGMLLDQQFPMERAFAGPALLAQRLGMPERLDPAVIAATDEEVLRTAAAGPPAIHRYPGSMVQRIQRLAQFVCDQHGGDAARVWRDCATGAECQAALRALPGFGKQKALIFQALLGKQFGFRPPGWQEACAPYGDPGSRMSVADVVDAATLAEVRAYKQAQKAAARGAG